MERAVQRELPRVRVGRIHAHAVERDEAIELIVARAQGGLGGFVLTPNVDHIAIAQHAPALVDAYRRSLPVVGRRDADRAMSRLLRLPLATKVSGSDLFEPLLARCAAERTARLLPRFQRGLVPAGQAMLEERYPEIEITGYDDSCYDTERNMATAVARAPPRPCQWRSDHHLLTSSGQAGPAVTAHVGVRPGGRCRHGRRAQLLRRRDQAIAALDLEVWTSSGCTACCRSPSDSGAGISSRTSVPSPSSSAWCGDD